MLVTKTVLITDLDNTLFDWFGVWYASNSAMLSRVCEISGLDKSVILPEIKAVHQRHGTAEYAFLLQELPSLQNLYGTPEEIMKVMDEAVHAFNLERKRLLKLYPTVLDTLNSLKDQGVLVIAYTESKSYYTAYRIKKLGLDRVIDFLYSPPDHDVPDGFIGTKFEFEVTVHRHTPEGEIKPNPKLLLDIISDVGATPEECVYIGDSEMKDIAMAQQAGISDVLARYGAEHFDTNPSGYELLRAVTHWTDEDVEREKTIKQNYHGTPASFAVDRFSELMGKFKFAAFQGTSL